MLYRSLIVKKAFFVTFVSILMICAIFNVITVVTLPYHQVFAEVISSSKHQDGLSINIDGVGGVEAKGGFSSRVIQSVALVTILSLAPAIVMMVTSFTRIIVVLSILRNAIGLQQSPPNIVITSLALFLTFFIMSPYTTRAYEEAVLPLTENTISEEVAWERLQSPFREFMLKHVGKKELAMFADMAKINLTNKDNEEVSFQALVPAFMITELKKAFEAGFLLFLPFLIIDIIVASLLMGMGMMMMPPVMIALPLKIIFFVVVDGWYLICGSLVKSYGLN